MNGLLGYVVAEIAMAWTAEWRVRPLPWKIHRWTRRMAALNELQVLLCTRQSPKSVTRILLLRLRRTTRAARSLFLKIQDLLPLYAMASKLGKLMAFLLETGQNKDLSYCCRL